jgi:MFS family permease
MANKENKNKANDSATRSSTVESRKENSAQSSASTGKSKALIWGISILLLASLSVYAHVRLSAIGEEYRGWLSPLDRLFDLLLSLLLLATAFGVGRWLSGRLSVRFANLAEELAMSVMLGVGVVGLLILGCGMLGWFRALPMGLLFAALLAATYRQMLRLGEMLSEAAQRNLFSNQRRVIAWLFVGLLVLLAIRAGLPPHAVDEAIYHLAAPKDFVAAGRIYPLWDNFSGNMPLLPHMFYVVCLIAKADSAARLFSLWLAVVTALALYGFAARFMNRKIATLAMFGFFGAGMVMEVAVTTRVDVSLAGMLFVATYAMMNYFETEERGWLSVSALLSGFSLGIKYTAGAWIALMALMYVYESLFRKRQRFATFFTQGILFVAIALVAFSPWLLKNYAYFKNPVYPFVTGEVAEHDAQGVRYFNAEDERKMDAYFEQSKKEIPQVVANINAEMAGAEAKREQRHPFRFWEFFTKSEIYNMGAAEGHHDPNFLFLVAPLLLFLPKQRWLVWLGIFCVAFFCFVAATSWIARYYLPLYPALTLIAVYSLATLAEKLRAQAPIANALPAIAVTTAVLLSVFVFAVQIYVSGGVSYFIGSLSRREFLKAAFYYPPVDFINHNTAPDAKVMMIGAQMGYHLQRDYLAEAGWDTVEWQRLMIRNNSMEEINQDLKRQGITHILYSPGLYRFVAEMGRAGSGPSGSTYNSLAAKNGKDYQVQLRNWATFELYRSRYLETVQSFNKENAEYDLLKIK